MTDTKHYSKAIIAIYKYGTTAVIYPHALASLVHYSLNHCWCLSYVYQYCFTPQKYTTFQGNERKPKNRQIKTTKNIMDDLCNSNSGTVDNGASNESTYLPHLLNGRCYTHDRTRFYGLSALSCGNSDLVRYLLSLSRESDSTIN